MNIWVGELWSNERLSGWALELVSFRVDEFLRGWVFKLVSFGGDEFWSGWDFDLMFFEWMSWWVDVFGSCWGLCVYKPLSWLVLHSARFVETLKVKATSLYNTRARERWARSQHLSFSVAPSLPYPPRHFTLSPTPFYPIPHAISPHPQSHLFTLSPFHPFTFSPFHPFTFKCPFTFSPFKGRSHLITFSPFHLFTLWFPIAIAANRAWWG